MVYSEISPSSTVYWKALASLTWEGLSLNRKLLGLVPGGITVGPNECWVEGSPDMVLYEIAPGGEIPIGVIHLEACTVRNVTFSGLGIVGIRKSCVGGWTIATLVREALMRGSQETNG